MSIKEEFYAIEYLAFGALTAILTILKLTDLLHWSWWVVLFPLWFPILVWGGMLAILFMILGYLEWEKQMLMKKL